MATGTATLDFGSTPADTAEVTISGLSGLTAASYIEAFFMSEATADDTVDEHEEAAALCALVCKYVSATSFKIIAHPIAALGVGTFNVRWVTA